MARKTEKKKKRKDSIDVVFLIEISVIEHDRQVRDCMSVIRSVISS